MRLSIWRQWSSNHSSGFTIIGEFETTEAARRAEAKLRQMLFQITEWRAQPDNLDEQGWARTYFEVVTPPERAIARQYNIEWGEHSVDWISSPDQVDDALRRLDNRLFLTSIVRSNIGPQPFDRLMESVGGTPFVTGEIGDYAAVVSIKCRAANVGIAESLVAELEHYFSNPLELRPPWKEYPTSIEMQLPTGERITVTDNELRDSESWYSELKARERAALAQWMQSDTYKQYMREISSAFSRGDRDEGSRLQEELHEHQMRDPERTLTLHLQQATDEVTKRRFSIALHASLLDMGTPVLAYTGHIRRTAHQIELYDVIYGEPQFGIPATLNYLENAGCTDIAYTLDMRS